MFSVVGIGGAGCRIVDAFYKKDPLSSLFSLLAPGKQEKLKGVGIDTSETISSLKHLPVENRVLIGRSRAKGHGTGADVELGRKIMEEEIELAMNAVRRVNTDKPEVFFVIAGLGGGTGTGGAPVIAERLRKYYRVPVVGIFLLPSRGEGLHYIKNVGRYFASVAGSVDGCLFLDNNVLTSRGEDIARSHAIITATITNFMSIADARLVAKEVWGKKATIGFMRIKGDHMSLKDIIARMLRDHIYINLEEVRPRKVHLLINGDVRSVYGESFAVEWVRKKLGAEMSFSSQEVTGSKHLNIGMIITGIDDIIKSYEVKEEKEEKRLSPELEDLLEDISPL
ncbi:hypothetical protein [Candidatus Pyrohabitans sp.]